MSFNSVSLIGNLLLPAGVIIVIVVACAAVAAGAALLVWHLLGKRRERRKEAPAARPKASPKAAPEGRSAEKKAAPVSAPVSASVPAVRAVSLIPAVKKPPVSEGTGSGTLKEPAPKAPSAAAKEAVATESTEEERKRQEIINRVAAPDAEGALLAEQLNLSEEELERLRMQEVDEKLAPRPLWTVHTRYNYSFRAKLIQSNDKVKARYQEILRLLSGYKKVKVGKGRKKLRVRAGKETLGFILFSGKTLTMTFALDIENYRDSKYVKDCSNKKSLRLTPVMVKLSSDRKVKFAGELISELAGRYALQTVISDFTPEEIPFEDDAALLEKGLIRPVKHRARVEGLQIVESVTVQEAQKSLSDEAAAAYIEEAPAPVQRSGKPVRAIVNVDVLSGVFEAGAAVTLDSLKEKGLVPKKVNYVKVLARGTLNKPLCFALQAYSIDAVKMIVLTGGTVTKTN